MFDFNQTRRRILAVALAMTASPVISSPVASAQEDPFSPSQLTAPVEGPRLMIKKVEVRQPLFLPAPGEAERKILAALDEKTEVAFIDTPLVDAIQFTAMQSGISMILDRNSLDDAGISSDEPVTAALAGISLRSALKIILGDLGLTSVIEDEVLKITTKEAAAAKEITRVYPVGDLVSSSDESSWSELAEAVQSGVLKGRWQTVDGTGGTVSIVRSAQALVIRQTRGAHDQIVELLVSLRDARQLTPQPPQLGEESIELPGPVSSLTVEGKLVVISLQAGAEGEPAQVKFEGTKESISKAVERISKLKRLADSSVSIRADPDAEHKDVVLLLDALQKVGVEKLSLSVLEEPAEGK